MTVSEEKRTLRKALRTRELALSNEYQARSGAVIVNALLSMDAYQNADCVCCFVGTGPEIDTRPVLSDALSSGKRVCVPLCVGRGVMRMRRIASVNELSPGAFGIPEPSPDTPTVAPSDIDFLIAPCLACDRSGRRLGRGGGYYDRFLSDYRGASVLLCREAMLLDRVPTDSYDVIIPLVLSENGLYRNGVLYKI